MPVDLDALLKPWFRAVMDEAGRPSFQLLAERMHVREPARAARLAVALPVSYLAFDVLRSKGRELLATPYTIRRELLEALPLGPRAVIPPSFDDGPATVTASRDNALEGVVAKRTGSAPARRSRAPNQGSVFTSLR